MLNTKLSPWPKYSLDEIRATTRVLKSGKVNYWTGSECIEFEREFSKYIGSNYAIALSNGTVAIDLALKALDISNGDEVIVTSRSYIASVSSIINAGAIPVFADVCLNSQNITNKNIKQLITKKTKAIICVHLAGFPCEMDSILETANENNIFVIEDCAQAHGAQYKGRHVGSIGDVGCWSFCQDKIMTTGGEGGMVTTNNKKLWSKMWSYKDHGKSFLKVHQKQKKPGFKWVHDNFGTNWRMNEVQACIGRLQLKKMDEWTKKRNANQQKIWSECDKFPFLRTPKFNRKDWPYYHPKNVHGAYKCYVFLDKKKLKKGWTRDSIMQKILEKGIPCFSGSCSEIYREKAFKGTGFVPKIRLENAKILGETSLMFLIHPTLTTSDINKTCKAIREVMLQVQNN